MLTDLEKYLAEVEERVKDEQRWPGQYAQAKASQDDVRRLLEMVRKLRSYLLYITAETDVQVVHVKAGEGMLDAGRIARAAMEKSGG